MDADTKEGISILRVRERIVEDQSLEGVTLEYVQLTKEFEEIRDYVLHKGAKITAYTEQREAVSIRVEDIFYFEAVGGLVFAYLESEVYEIRLRLYQIEERLNMHNMVRASKSVLMNLNYIDSVRPALNGRLYAKMQNGEDILISRNYAKLVSKRILEDDYERI